MILNKILFPKEIRTKSTGKGRSQSESPSPPPGIKRCGAYFPLFVPAQAAVGGGLG